MWLICGLACILFSGLIHAQQYRVHGFVMDASTRAGLPFANVVFQGSSEGRITEANGEFLLDSKHDHDSVMVSMLGYKTQVIGVPKESGQSIEVLLQPAAFELSEVSITPGENPAFEVLRRVIANKSMNRPEALDAYQYSAHHRVRFDLNNFTDRIKRNFFLKPFDYIWENTDTTNGGVRYLPVLLTESSEENYYRKEPSTYRTIIKGRRTFKFFKAPRIMAFVEDMYIDPNIYDNYVLILDRSFPSPINDDLNNHYRFYLDTGLHELEGHACKRITFIPKVDRDAAFTGEMFIDTMRSAVVRIDLNFSIEANINFVRSYAIRQHYTLVDGEHWFLRKSQLLVDLTVIENAKEMTGFFGRKTTEISNVVIGQPHDNAFYSALEPVQTQDSTYMRDDAFWNNARSEPFTEREEELIHMTERMNEDPKWKRLEKGVRLLSNGWLTMGKIDVGNMYTFYSWNNIEGSRIKLGMRTNSYFSRKLHLGGYGAYGLADERFKGGGDLQFNFFGERNRKTGLGVHYRNDLHQIGRSDNALPLDHVLTSFVRISGAQKRLDREEAEVFVDRYWSSRFKTKATLFRDQFSMLQRVTHLDDGITDPTGPYTAAGVKLGVRLGLGAYGSHVLNGDTREPDDQDEDASAFTVESTFGFKEVFGSQFNYQRYRAIVQHEIRANRWGRLGLIAEGGIINGQLPFPFLHTPHGNPLLFNDDQAFNLMNYMEFVSDRYALLQLEHHFDGFLLNRIPGINRLKWRSFLLGKFYYGTLSDENNIGRYPLADGMERMRDPYSEVGFGIENILKIARIDVTWRLTHLNEPNTLKFIVKPSFYFRF